MSWRVAVQMRLGAFELDVDIGGSDTPVALIGPNGSGKTTLLRTIAGAHRPDAGCVRVGGEDVFDAATGLDLSPERRRVGYVPQGYGLFPHLSVLDNVAFAWTARGPRLRRTERRRRARAQLASLGCTHLADRAVTTLSGGERQRVALARALTTEPRLLILDEPLAALDALARRTIRGFLARYLAERGGAALVVSHEAGDVRELGARVHVMEDGRIVQSGSPEELASRPATEFVAAFFDVWQ